MSKRTLNFTQYATIQNDLNEFTQESWRETLSPDHFKTAMFDEFAELLGSTNWKWWKHQDQFDEWNMKIEIIDIFHFAMSIFVLNRQFELSPNHEFGETTTDHSTLVEENGDIVHSEFMKVSLDLLGQCRPSDMEMLFNVAGMTPEEISAIYMVKSQLNFFRQSSGYKDGTYVKVVDGVEDNVRLERLVKTFITEKSMNLEDLQTMTITEFYKPNET